MQRRTVGAVVRLALLACVAAAALVAAAPQPAQAAPPPAASPHYYYDRETAFLINNAIDPVYGGLFVAVDEDGSLLEDPMPLDVWGFPPNLVRGVMKSHIGQGTCVRYFITEYQRVTASGVGVAGINALLRPGRAPLASPLALLGYARSCADFATGHMEIAPDDALAEPPDARGLLPAGADQGDAAIPNRLFYWGFTGRSGEAELVDDTFPNGGRSAGRSESALTWSIAELALALQRAGRPEAEWGPYRDAVLRWWGWRRTAAQPLPPYGDPAAPAFQDGCGGLPDNPDNCIPGIGRDIFYAPIGYALAELTGDATYREGDGSAMADGMPYGARPFANRILGTGTTADLTYPPRFALQDGAYPAGFSRAVLYAWELQRLGGAPEQRDQYWDFSIYPALVDTGSGYAVRPLTDQSIYSPQALGRPFTHFGGRELVAGVQRTHWLFGTFGVNPQSYYATPGLDARDFRDAAYDFWQFANTSFWDDTPGQQAWFEAQGQPYKPCFAGGTDVPMADWLPPTIGSKEHSPATPAPGEPVTVTVGGVRDPGWPYLSMALAGSGVRQVEVAYSLDGGATWATLAAAPGAPGTYTATIPGQAVDTTVLYYARARDAFGNWAAFPAGAERWDSAGASVRSAAEAQRYQVSPPTAIELSSFSARREDGAVVVRWETAAEIGTLGFRVLRSATGLRADAQQVSGALIPAEGGPAAGASYVWADAGAQDGVVFSYWLQEVEAGGGVNEYGPVSTATGSEILGQTLYAPVIFR